ncbi:hypothetical protein [Phycicoccus flavus]|uniref:hypothetical protein n=1 Tax=Phycicoccus flavus TaxID=2502783 RepID=UPI000FEBB80B|nr:hypothetical protein [Phycicoccus flavus]NHA69164.1 hypothetical protein [Phycicoccus flavus]
MNRRRRDWWLVTAWLGSLALVRAGSIEDTDPYWQVRAGVETLRGLPLVRPDSWSWDPVATPFFQTSPGWNVVLGLGWDAARYAGVFLVGLASIGTYLLVAVLLARRLGARPLPTLAGVLLCVLPALAMVSPRATLVAQTVFMAAVLAADSWRRRPRPAAAVDIAVVLAAAWALTSLGSWVHLSWVALAPATAVCWAVIWFTTAEIARVRALLLSAAGAVGAAAGALTGPYGLDVLVYTRRVRGAADGLVVEWLSVLTPGLALRWLPATLLALVVSGAGLLLAWRRWRTDASDPRAGLVAALCIVALPAALASFSAIRFVGIALLAVAPVGAVAATATWDRIRARAAERPPRGPFRSARVRFWSDGARWRVVLTVVVAILAPGTLLLTLPLSRPLPELAAADALPDSCRLVSDTSSAAVVLLARPDVPVWFDGRFDYWGHDRSAAAVRTLARADLTAPPFSDAGCVMLTTGNDLSGGALEAALDASAQWRPAGPGGPVRVWVRG